MASRRVVQRLFVAVTVATTSAVESGAASLARITPATLSCLIQCTSLSGTPDVKIEYAVSSDGTTFGSYADFDALISSTLAAWGATAQGVHVEELTVPMTPWIRFRVTGVGANPADTLVSIDLYGEEL